MFAPAAKTRLATVSSAASETPVVLEEEKVAISDAPFGTRAGVQFAGVFQSLVAGAALQVALPARAAGAEKARASEEKPKRKRPPLRTYFLMRLSLTTRRPKQDISPPLRSHTLPLPRVPSVQPGNARSKLGTRDRKDQHVRNGQGARVTRPREMNQESNDCPNRISDLRKRTCGVGKRVCVLRKRTCVSQKQACLSGKRGSVFQKETCVS